MTVALVAYVPVLHDGYWRFINAHGTGRELYLIGAELHAEHRPLAKDVRALSAEQAAAAIRGWEICSAVHVLDAEGAQRVSDAGTELILPDEDISQLVVARFFPRAPVRYDTVFLRWDKSRTVALLHPNTTVTVSIDEAGADLAGEAERQAGRSVDWWRQVGAAIRFADGRTASAVNEHLPHPLSAYAVGDPRTNFSQGVHLELSTAVHAEAGLIAQAAREGIATAGAVMYVTDLPCPPCAKLIAGAGVAKLYYRTGYGVLDGLDVLERAGVEIVRVEADSPTP